MEALSAIIKAQNAKYQKGIQDLLLADDESDEGDDWDILLTTIHLEHKMSEPNDHAKPETAAALLRFDSAAAMDEFITTNARAREFLDGFEKWFISASPEERAKQTRVEKVKAVWETGERKYRFSSAEAADQHNWANTEWHAYLLCNFIRHLVNAEAAHVSSCNWDKDIAVDRMWLLISRAKLMVSERCSIPTLCTLPIRGISS